MGLRVRDFLGNEALEGFRAVEVERLRHKFVGALRDRISDTPALNPRKSVFSAPSLLTFWFLTLVKNLAFGFSGLLEKLEIAIWLFWLQLTTGLQTPGPDTDTAPEYSTLEYIPGS